MIQFNDSKDYFIFTLGASSNRRPLLDRRPLATERPWQQQSSIKDAVKVRLMYNKG